MVEIVKNEDFYQFLQFTRKTLFAEKIGIVKILKNHCGKLSYESLDRCM